VVGLSGGVDPSVAAALLVEQGFDVVGITLRVWPWQESDDPAKRFGSCCSPATVDDARQVARRLGIPYYLLNSAEEFERTVIENFAREYEAGRTPVPCTVCNREIKFGSLLHRARAWDAAAVATGHYARVTRDPRTERFLLWRGADARKDQSDFLWPLSQAQLGAARFPVGALSKPEVRTRPGPSGSSRPRNPRARRSASSPTTTIAASCARAFPAPSVADPSWTEPGGSWASTRASRTTRSASVVGSAWLWAARSTSRRSTPRRTPWWLVTRATWMLRPWSPIRRTGSPSSDSRAR